MSGGWREGGGRLCKTGVTDERVDNALQPTAGSVGLCLARAPLLVALGLTVTRRKIVEIDMVADPARLRQLALAVLNDNDGDTVGPGAAARMPTLWRLPKYWQPRFGTRFTQPSRDGT
jgi:hypothetical protein